MTRWVLICLACLTLASRPGWASPKVAIKPPDASSLLPLLNGSTDAVAGAIRGYLVRSMPDPLYEDWPNWGKTASAPKFPWNGPDKRRNHGKWRHVRVWADR